ncbi:hypothetical protein KIH74_34825 [Kineosporia sp. J2-2]|uniref:Uncharacterized protein n=1 Tax=Kineosporia corallincola TaxID=2835133 RepID=A0ABS5TTP7_9ACTN|nr:hypothetical protein [Kineosporia corallincola]MBT0774172.1 hypothetical protein [Kineosporia corallincola]
MTEHRNEHLCETTSTTMRQNSILTSRFAADDINHGDGNGGDAVHPRPGQALVIPADLRRPIHVTDITATAMRAHQHLLHGTVTQHMLRRPAGHLYTSEDAVRQRPPRNPRADVLHRLCGADTLLERLTGPDILGDAVVVGPRHHGQDTSAPQALLDLADYPGPYQVQLRTLGRPDTWATRSRRYDTWPAAGTAALELARDLTMVCDVRIVPAVSHEQHREWAYTASLTPAPYRRPGMPATLLDPDQIIPCASVSELAAHLTGDITPHQETPTANAFQYQDLCLVRCAGDAPAWLALRHHVTVPLEVDFRPWPPVVCAQLIRLLLNATREQLLIQQP